ncbi:hypothetical protein [Algisphaera agarilytica]|uniref:Uncharacterized protein n=1 Tax=Algisphaera agarilytica TaxID=1385975 RepID=A0A7X0H8Q2_9BACT|nr:hypothetical protein [Algisphaera agarilytica]MBB6430161.1 hypothetical protein [Algisphaera agarilytica]
MNRPGNQSIETTAAKPTTAWVLRCLFAGVTVCGAAAGLTLSQFEPASVLASASGEYDAAPVVALADGGAVSMDWPAAVEGVRSSEPRVAERAGGMVYMVEGGSVLPAASGDEPRVVDLPPHPGDMGGGSAVTYVGVEPAGDTGAVVPATEELQPSTRRRRTAGSSSRTAEDVLVPESPERDAEVVAPSPVDAEPVAEAPVVEEASEPEPETSAEPDPALIEKYRQQLTAYFLIGNSSTRLDRRTVGWNLAASGWPGFRTRYVEPALDYGFRRVHLHNPFGEDGQWPMELDQVIRAREAGLDWLVDDFVETWLPVTRGDLTGGEPVEVIAYFGTARLDEFETLEAAGDWDGWMARAEESIRPALDAGMSIAFDSFSVAPEGSYSHQFAEMIKQRGVRVYIETWPNRDAPHWKDTHIVVEERWYLRNHRHPNVFRRNELSGEVVRLLHSQMTPDPIDNPKPHSQRVVEAMVQGYTIAIQPRWLWEESPDLDELLAEAVRAAELTYD